MARPSFKKKYKTAHTFGSRKRKSPMRKKKSRPLAFKSESFVDGQRDAEVDESPSTLDAVAFAEETPSTSTGRTVLAHLQPRFRSPEAAREQDTAVQGSLSSVSATERKMKLFAESEEPASAEKSEEFLVIQVAVMNALLATTPCEQCLQPGLTVVPGTRHELAAKMILNCGRCGAVANEWTSPRREGGRVFEANLRSMQATKSIGKGSTALTDFWSIMNVSHRGLHQKTFQKHLKAEFRPAGDAASASVFSDAVEAVRKVYAEMNPCFTKNITSLRWHLDDAWPHIPHWCRHCD